MCTRTTNYAAAMMLLAMSGCTVGPDYQPPSVRTPEAFTGLELAGQAGALSAAEASPAAVTAWWTTFDDPTLSGLVERAVRENLSIQQAIARVRQARAQRRIAGADELPTLDAIGSVERSRSRSGGGARTGNLFRAGFDATWEIDVFGGIRRNVEAADENLRASIEDARDVRVSLAAEVASTYIDLRSQQRRLAIARKNLALQQDTAGLTSERFEAGFVGSLDVANARSLVASTASRIPSLESGIRADVYALSVLLALEPAALMHELEPLAPIPVAPARVPVGLPSELLMRRPDIRRAEAILAAQNARIGVAASDLYPRFSLTGSFGLQGSEASALGSLAQRYWSVGPSVRWNVFDSGRIRAGIDERRAIFDEQLSVYQQSVLVALQDVETALVAFAKEQERRLALIEAVDANRIAVEVATELYTGGRTDFLNVLSAQGRLLDAEDQLSQSEQAISTNLVALYKALGGGWSPSDLETSIPSPGAVPENRQP